MNRVSEIIKEKQTTSFLFSPSREFYLTIGVKQKRFGQIMRNEKQPTIDELQRIAEYFGVTVQELIKD